MKDSAIAVFWCDDFDINQGETSLLINISNKSGFDSLKNWKQVKGFISHWIMINIYICVEMEEFHGESISEPIDLLMTLYFYFFNYKHY